MLMADRSGSLLHLFTQGNGLACWLTDAIGQDGALSASNPDESDLLPQASHLQLDLRTPDLALVALHRR